MFGKKVNPQTCERCPHRHDAAGCPCWISEQAGFLETNSATGEARFVTGCFYQVIPRLMCEVIAASNRPAAAIEGTRNEISRGLALIAQGMAQPRGVPAVAAEPAAEQIAHAKGEDAAE